MTDVIQRAFLPVCSYSNRLCSRAGASIALAIMTSRFDETLVLIADSLQEINLRHKGLSPSVAARNAEIDASNRVSMYESIIRSNNWVGIRVERMSHLINSPALQDLQEVLLPTLYQESAFAREAKRFVYLASRRFGWSSGGDAVGLESEYLHAELLVSIYVTEVLGYNWEVWEQLPRLSTPDPLGVAYKVAAVLLGNLLRKDQLQRKLISIDSVDRSPSSELSLSELLYGNNVES